MKKILRIAGLLIALIASTSVNAQTNSSKQTSPPSDASSGFTYDFDKTRDLIIQRLTNPQKSNADVQVFLEQKDFPAFTNGKKIDTSYKDELRKWMEKNSNLIINTLKSRKDIVTQY